MNDKLEGLFAVVALGAFQVCFYTGLYTIVRLLWQLMA